MSSYQESLNKMKEIVKNGDYKRAVYECDREETRDRNKLEEYRTGARCPVFEDNGCCGGCSLVSVCDFCVDCNCFGFFYAAKGGEKSVYSTPASDRTLGLDENGQYKSELYYLNRNKRKISKYKSIKNKFIDIYDDEKKSIIISELNEENNTIRCMRISTQEEYDLDITKGILIIYETNFC